MQTAGPTRIYYNKIELPHVEAFLVATCHTAFAWKLLFNGFVLGVPVTLHRTFQFVSKSHFLQGVFTAKVSLAGWAQGGLAISGGRGVG